MYCCHGADILQAREAKGEDTQLAASDNEDLDAGELSDSEDQLDENAVLSKLADEAIRFQVRGWAEGHTHTKCSSGCELQCSQVAIDLPVE